MVYTISILYFRHTMNSLKVRYSDTGISRDFYAYENYF